MTFAHFYPVGYQNKELSYQANSFVAMTLQPIGVAKADVTLSQFVPTDGENGWMYNADFLMTLKPNGTTDKTYGYLSPYWAGPDGLDDKTAAGWHLFVNLQNDEFYGERCDSIPLASGQAIAVFTSMQGIELVIPSALK